jgi:hypothetical protein
LYSVETDQTLVRFEQDISSAVNQRSIRRGSLRVDTSERKILQGKSADTHPELLKPRTQAPFGQVVSESEKSARRFAIPAGSFMPDGFIFSFIREIFSFWLRGLNRGVIYATMCRRRLFPVLFEIVCHYKRM